MHNLQSTVALQLSKARKRTLLGWGGRVGVRGVQYYSMSNNSTFNLAPWSESTELQGCRGFSLMRPFQGEPLKGPLRNDLISENPLQPCNSVDSDQGARLKVELLLIE